MVRNFFVFVFNICLFTLYGQKDIGKEIYIETVPQLEVINEQIYQILDSAILYNKDCIYAIRGKPYYFKINLYEKENDTVDIYIDSWQYTFVFTFRDVKKVGCFYYKDNLVIVKKTSDITSSFFQTTSDTMQLYFKKSNPYLRCHFHGYELMSLTYSYINGIFIPKHKILCTGIPYYHLVTRGGGILETWESLAEYYEITVEELKSLNKKKSKKPLKSRDVIRVY